MEPEVGTLLSKVSAVAEKGAHSAYQEFKRGDKKYIEWDTRSDCDAGTARTCLLENLP